MLRLSSVIFAALLLVGCVSVEESVGNQRYNPVEAADKRIALGVQYLSQRDMPRARDNFQQALTLAPDYYRSLLSMAYYYQQVNEPEQAESYYKMALRKNPRNGDVLNNYGVFLCREKKYEEAIRMFERAVEQPDYNQVASSFENAGLCAIGQNDTEAAKAFLTRALSHDQNRPMSVLQLSRLQIDAGEFAQARANLMKFNKQYGYKPDSLFLLIQLEEKAGRTQERDRYVKLLASQYPESTQYQQYLANDY
ncbi:type IV pilus biogenesis/stability protein PilW [Thaumasiovibrio subtropicus]|uniref:type IV pilus biogenesis/stability protein PilW n=1 Tax=Thaumasiovibrio subtropicus TaxID=1891207 RepID=UPI000B34FA7B|nr:type IV pilus biogenesis/stability protein PilW [Thaumasiovibrio subtropicus]